MARSWAWQPGRHGVVIVRSRVDLVVRGLPIAHGVTFAIDVETAERMVDASEVEPADRLGRAMTALDLELERRRPALDEPSTTA